MSNIKIKIKGIEQITLSGNYNSLAPYFQYKDDAKMADTTNAFTDYLSSSGCNPNDDKIVIKQLPDKGSLFYLTNPTAPTPVYAVVTLGQSILVKDILINKVLKFQAEGLSDNAFTGTYMTTFKFERLCGIASNNIIASVNLSMVDEMVINILNQYYININYKNEIDGWNDETSGGINTSTGTKELLFTDLLGVNKGMVRYKSKSDYMNIWKINKSITFLDVVVDEAIPVSNELRVILMSQCSGASDCVPSVYTDAYFTFEYSIDGLQWKSFNLIPSPILIE